MHDKDFKIEVTRGHGNGGQHRNKVETCVKITYVPLGMSETCQDTRSKIKNLELAKSRLVKRIEIYEQNLINKKKNSFRKEQITQQRRRTYNFKTGIVTDHITNKKASLKDVLDGNLELLK